MPMDKELIKRIIGENHSYLDSVSLIPRPFSFEDNGNYVFLGIRRAGKSFLMYQRIKELVKKGTDMESILYINFEDERLYGLSLMELDQIKQTFEENYSQKPIFFLDEIQIIEGWEKFVRRLADKDYRVYVTGSNAKMLSSEISTTLGGRFLIKNVFPFSFEEYLSASNISLSRNWEYRPEVKNKVAKCFSQYFYYGGFPEIVRFDNKREWLQGLFHKIFFGDLIARYGVRNSDSMRLLIKKLAESIMQPSSYNHLKNIVSSAGDKVSVAAIIDYISYLKETLIVFELRNYASCFAERETSKKYYFLDNGILNLFLFNPDTLLLENFVAINLYKRYGDDLFYYNRNVEVDFYVQSEGMLVQVSWSIAEQSTYDREVGALVKTTKFLNGKRHIIVTRDTEDTIEVEGIRIEVVPVWKWNEIISSNSK